MKSYKETKDQLKKMILQQLDLTMELSDEQIQELIQETIMNYGKEEFLTLQMKEKLTRELFFSIRKLDILQELIENPDITEIMVNGTENIFIEMQGSIYQWQERFESREKLEDVIQQIVSGCNRVVNETTPIVDARLQNGSRVNVVLAPVAINGPILTIRRFPEKPLGMKELIELGSLDQEVAEFLKMLVIAGFNIFISGGTGSGKTTFLNALSQYIPKEERIITIEDSAELQIIDKPNLVRLETRNANVEGCEKITIRDLIRSSLRMRPDRIIIGEIRGSEAIDTLQAMNTGHDGSLSTGHANSARDMLSRLETMVLMGMELPLTAIRRQIASGVNIIIHLGRLRDKTRKVLEIVEITGYENENIITRTLFQYTESGIDVKGKVLGKLQKTNSILCKEKILAAGIEYLEVLDLNTQTVQEKNA